MEFSNVNETKVMNQALNLDGNPNIKVRLRRTLSSSRAEDIVTAEHKVRRSQPDNPIHSPSDSLLSWTSSFQNYEGMFNWGGLLLFLGSLRLFLENLNKYGVRVSPSNWCRFLYGGSGDSDSIQVSLLQRFPVLYLLVFSLVPVYNTWNLEQWLAKGNIDWKSGCLLHSMNLIFTLLVPVILINMLSCNILSSMMVCMIYTIIVLKLISYIQVNKWCRDKFRRNTQTNGNDILLRERMKTAMNIKEAKEFESSKLEESTRDSQLTQWPDNLTLNDVSYFILAPTLCYELNFPRTSRTRKFFLLRRVLEVILGTNLILALIQQWMVPNVIRSLVPFHSLEWPLTIERLLKLSLPNHIIWLVFFYIYFHSFLNTLGELLNFADRRFYHDWWNSSNLEKFWQNWNLPVHKWCVRHLYKPLLRMGFSKLYSLVVVFLFSAILHEYLLSVPLKMFKPWAFLGMFGQIPLIILSKKAELVLGRGAGNLMMWSSLILGHPLAIMMYYHDYIIENYGASLVSQYGSLQNSSL